MTAMNATDAAINKHHSAAQSALREGRLREAHQRCLAILKLDQSHADAWFLCGVIAAQNGHPGKAEKIFRKAIELAPANAEYRAELGKQLIALREPERALQTARETLALHPTGLPTLNTLGTLFSHCGEHETALGCFAEVARSLQSTADGAKPLPIDWQADFYFNMAASLQFAGRFDEAESAYEQAIALQPHLFKAHSALSQLRRQTPEKNHLKRLQSLRREISTAVDQLHLGHAIAREQEDLGQYQASLASLAWAKLAQAEKIDYHTNADAALFATIRRLFNRDLFSRQPVDHSACDNAEPIFIVGMPRTGTTLVEQILSGHSQVYAAGELQNFPLQVKRLTGTPSNDLLDSTTLEQSLQLDMALLGTGYIDSTRPRTGHTAHFIDKLPLNFLYLGLLKLALPKARLICLRRDPMDTCLSNYRQLFATNFKYYYYNLDLLDCGRYYMRFDQLMRHWQEVMPGAVHEVQYEALVENPEQVSKALLAYCDLPWEAQCLAFHQRKTSVATASAVQVRSAIYRSSVNRWQRYGDALKPLQDLLRSAGYYQ